MIAANGARSVMRGVQQRQRRAPFRRRSASFDGHTPAVFLTNSLRLAHARRHACMPPRTDSERIRASPAEIVRGSSTTVSFGNIS